MSRLTPADLDHLLADAPVFAGLNSEEREELASRLALRDLKPRQYLFAQGDVGTTAYLVVDGVLKLSWPSHIGEELVVRMVRPPELFGELALLDGQPRSAWAEAAGQATVAVITLATWSWLLDRPAFVRHLLAELAGRLRVTTQQLAEHALADLAGRVAAELLRLADHHGIPEGDGIRVAMPMTQRELAAVVAASRQSVNQVLRTFERRGDIVVEDQTILLRRPDVLRRRAVV
jgi:CRP/FNR family transcriptional regulator, cyclic AMP receptor protein